MPASIVQSTTPALSADIEKLREELKHVHEALELEREARLITRGLLDNSNRQLQDPNDMNAYITKKAHEYAREIAQKEREHERQILIAQEEHIADRERLSDMQLTIEAVQNTENDLRAETAKLAEFNKQQKHHLDTVLMRLKVLQQIHGNSSDALVAFSGTGNKRSADEIELEDISRHKKPKNGKVTCTQCYTHGWKDCDGASICENCRLRGKAKCCKCVMCKYYKKNTCLNQSCTFAHEGDSYIVLVPFTRLQASGSGRSPVELKAREDEEARQKYGATYDNLFGMLLDNMKRRGKGDNNTSKA
ncbi:hypothetical protein EK21DRAFT_118825 [Setomelanomma holmii]|uniref:C3H1-type domain-containing protein n=1 Tax=Setomelanomma holmii TaxID=210430 RepID=A0A9P4GVB6_9PLEO|nr:hypothetical protein EK21DRAFT_118825 [Setomelanomma holmii]